MFFFLKSKATSCNVYIKKPVNKNIPHKCLTQQSATNTLKRSINNALI